MKNKMITAEQAAEMVKDGSSVMVGGFMSVGTPEILMDALVARNAKDLTVICNDGGTGRTAEVAPTGVGKLVENKCIKTLVATHIGLNKECAAQKNAGELEVQLVPQGTLAEVIRAGGAGLGGVLTPTGVGTEVAEGKQVLNLNGKAYILEMPMRAEVALIRGSIVDKAGNVYYKKTTQNFNKVMATAADIVIVAAEEIVEVGEIDPECIATPAIFVDFIVGGEK